MVIGAGFIGSEVAATCHGLGAEVTVVEALPTPLARVLGEQMGEAVRPPPPARTACTCSPVSEWRSHGRHRLGWRDGRRPPRWSSSWSTAVASRPTWSWWASAWSPPPSGSTGPGLDLDNGVVCTESLFAADRVVAAGDVARWTLPSTGEPLRVEHWTNAAEGGAAAARNLLAGSARRRPLRPRPLLLVRPVRDQDPDASASPVPTTRWWWWKDRSTREGWSALYRRGDRLRAALAFSRPRHLMAYRPLLAAGASFDEALAVARA